MKNLIILSTLMIIGSGCSTLPPAPLCPPDRPNLESLSVSSIQEVYLAGQEELIRIVASNDLRLKSHIKLLEDLIQAHNEQLGVECETD